MSIDGLPEGAMDIHVHAAHGDARHAPKRLAAAGKRELQIGDRRHALAQRDVSVRIQREPRREIDRALLHVDGEHGLVEWEQEAQGELFQIELSGCGRNHRFDVRLARERRDAIR